MSHRLVRTAGWAFLTPVAAVLLWKILASSDAFTVWQARAINAGAVLVLAGFLLHEGRVLWIGQTGVFMLLTALGTGWAIFQPDAWSWRFAWWAVQLFMVGGWAMIWFDAWWTSDDRVKILGFCMTLISAVGLMFGVVTGILWARPLNPWAPALKGSTADLTGAGWIEVILVLFCFAVVGAIISAWRER